MSLGAAASAWLCVETPFSKSLSQLSQYAATFGWLCVETGKQLLYPAAIKAATFGWLCVE
ncbi:hypothetical protein HMPREF9065_01462, partial [Aggregatibacter sp. oral taxon 458 str. W10330]